MAGGSRGEVSDGELLRWRLRSQRLVGPGFAPSAEGAAEVVRWLGAVQSQDHEPALWSLARRAAGVDRATLAAAFDAGAFLRTHVLRPTWHFVPPEEVCDLLALTGPRVAASCAPRWRELGLPPELRARATDLLVAAIAERGPLTRAELGEALAAGGVDTAGQRLPHLLLHAELEGALCSGGLRGRQQTWALLADRVPASRAPFDREAALRRLTVRYVGGHGPVTERDFAWWSGLTLRDVRSALELARPELDTVEACGRRWWFAEPPPADRFGDQPAVHLLQSFDEFLVAYSESRDLVDPHGLAARLPQGWLLRPVWVVDGRLAGRWQRALRPTRVEVTVTSFLPPSAALQEALTVEAERFAAFLGLPLRLTIEDES